MAEMHKDGVEKGGERYGRNSEKHHCGKGGQRRRSPCIILRSKGQDVCQEAGESAQAWGALDLGEGLCGIRVGAGRQGVWSQSLQRWSGQDRWMMGTGGVLSHLRYPLVEQPSQIDTKHT